MQSLKSYISADPRVGFKKEVVCSQCGGMHKDIYDKQGVFLYSTPCECEDVKEREIRSQELSELLYVDIAIENNRSKSGLTKTELTKLQDNYNIDKSNKDIYHQVIDWVAEFSQDTKRGFLFIGKPGTGKTRLALEIAEKLLAKGVRVYFTTAQRYMNDVKKGFDTDVPDVRVLANNATVLILDDIGAERGTAFEKAEILELINSRAGVKPTIITSNLNKEDLGIFYRGDSKNAKLDQKTADRIVSRIVDCAEKIFHFDGTDRRIIKYKQRESGVENGV